MEAAKGVAPAASPGGTVEPHGLLDRIKRLDAYPKVIDEFRVKTLSGAVVSIIAILCMFVLFCTLIASYWRTEVVDTLFVDKTRGEQMLVNFDLTFPRVPCAMISIGVMDASGHQQRDIQDNVYKKRLQPDGTPFGPSRKNEVGNTIATDPALLVANQTASIATATGGGIEPCGSCYGLGEPGQCCNTCKDVRDLYRKRGWNFLPDRISQCADEGFARNLRAQQKEGCNIYGSVAVPKVAGNLHFVPHEAAARWEPSFDNVVSGQFFNVSHTINSFYVGEAKPGGGDPLENTRQIYDADTGMHQYFVKLVPAEIVSLHGAPHYSYRYAVTQHFLPIRPTSRTAAPGVFFVWELSPLKVRMVETGRSLSELVTDVCAIVGGVFTIMGLVDNVIHHAVLAWRARRKGGELG